MVTTASQEAPFCATEHLILEYYKALLDVTEHNWFFKPTYRDYIAAQDHIDKDTNTINTDEHFFIGFENSLKEKNNLKTLLLQDLQDTNDSNDELSNTTISTVINTKTNTPTPAAIMVTETDIRTPKAISNNANNVPSNTELNDLTPMSKSNIKENCISDTETIVPDNDFPKDNGSLSRITKYINYLPIKRITKMMATSIPGWNSISMAITEFQSNRLKQQKIKELLKKRYEITSYNEWKEISLQLDHLTGKEDWKYEEESDLYDYQLVKDITLEMIHLRETKQYMKLLCLLRTKWVRNIGNMGNLNLYRQSHVGTKKIIDDYMHESTNALDALLNDSNLDTEYLLTVLQQTRRNIGRTALVLSGGGTFGLFHIGVLAALFEQDLLPRVISGSSAGAIVASILCVHQTEEIPGLLRQVLDMEFNIFTDDTEKSDSENLLIKISRFFQDGTWFDNKHLIKTMRSFLGDLTFREAYNRSGRILNVTVSPMSLFEQPRLLNNLTAPNVMIWSAVCASCSVPGIFPSTPLYEKDPHTGEKREWEGSTSVKFVDGSVDNDLPITRLSEMFNIDHIIACQVNLHVFPFLKMSLSCVGGDVQYEFNARLKSNISKVSNFISEEIMHYLELGCELGISKKLLTKLRSVLAQQYSGDITILPEMKMLLRLNSLLINPTKGFLLYESTYGARATWPKLYLIQNHCYQEIALDKAISYLRGKVVMSRSIKNPLQLFNPSLGLIKPIHKHNSINKNNTRDNSEKDEISPVVLDDNLIEPHNKKSMLLLPEKFSSPNNRLLDAIQHAEGLHADSDSSSSSIHRKRMQSDLTSYSSPTKLYHQQQLVSSSRSSRSRKLTSPSSFRLGRQTKRLQAPSYKGKIMNDMVYPLKDMTKPASSSPLRERRSPIPHLSTTPRYSSYTYPPQSPILRRNNRFRSYSLQAQKSAQTNNAKTTTTPLKARTRSNTIYYGELNDENASSRSLNMHIPDPAIIVEEPIKRNKPLNINTNITSSSLNLAPYRFENPQLNESTADEEEVGDKYSPVTPNKANCTF
ncbi:hypothetical protein TBLA_0A09160 [Henningerozyma blattae CBS 6284]|uniref:PNPLA domain-containing protein n=1 Tax=Henningerozyma blattae (strain ATCC 34711 / CBS 6284 / DSM 70876 / NBRC 10599 / NRRL Y-10934 / UCD 77-7) TaxID=1071380 RepID=I2GX52_HENB6|nr:hypothetical protein TBLA_0A09160 [Tetrapisispora blattae CBS 6284]CCH58704.1 hypothetical protein TBLA_0A09160 [Tetrapisispora blattae CBS 6284]